MSHPSEAAAELLQRNYSGCTDAEKLRIVVTDLQHLGKSLQAKIDDEQSALSVREKRVCALEEELKIRERAVANQESGYAENSCDPEWVLAERDYPTARSYVLYHNGRNFEVMSAKELQDRSVFISKFPSRWPGTIYVYTDNAVALSQGSQPRVRITSKKGQPDKLRWSKTLHLGKLPIGTKLGIVSGRIEWLFVTQADSRSSTESDDLLINERLG